MTALVFNCNLNGLSIIQELGRHGIEVIALDNIRSIGTYSRYANFWRCPDPSANEEDFITFLLEKGKAFTHKPVLFPTNDHWAMAISQHKQRLTEFYIPCVADYQAVKLVIHKQQFIEWAQQRGYPVPKSWSHQKIDQIPDDAFPIAAKPEYRRISSNNNQLPSLLSQLDQMRLTVLNNRDELNRFIAHHDVLIPYFVFQEYIRGLSNQMYTVGVYANQHYEIIGLFTGRKVRGFPPDVGDCIVGQVEPVPDMLIKITKNICHELKYQGIAEFEFKQNSETGEYKLIEINPRSWSWVGITPACGVSLPWIAYNDLIDPKNATPIFCQLPAGKVKWVRLLDDFVNCLYLNKKAGYPDWHFSFRQWWESLQADTLVIAEFAKDDLRPGFYIIWEYLKRVLRWMIK
ncbi:ATP-grasp domain-containing protein [Chloroflexota bacterium]